MTDNQSQAGVARPQPAPTPQPAVELHGNGRVFYIAAWVAMAVCVIQSVLGVLKAMNMDSSFAPVHAIIGGIQLIALIVVVVLGVLVWRSSGHNGLMVYSIVLLGMTLLQFALIGMNNVWAHLSMGGILFIFAVFLPFAVKTVLTLEPSQLPPDRPGFLE